MPHPLVRSLYALIAGVFVGTSSASPLSDLDLYFDPGALHPGFYPSVDLSPGGNLVLTGMPGRAIIGANILPILADNEYFPGFSYSQSDYSIQPNQPGTYSADLTSGTLTAQFDDDGAYNMRVNYSDGSFDIRSIYVNAGIGDANAGADAPNLAAPWKVVPAKGGDLYIISTGTANDDFVNSAKELLGNGANVARAATVAQAKAAIAARSLALGRKINVVIIGHGYQGSIRLGKKGDAAAERINNDGAATSTSGAAFGNAIKNHASSVNLFGCSTGGGLNGGRLLQDIQDTGVNASAYTSTVGLLKSGWFAHNWGTKVPAPGAAGLMGIAVIGLARRRRAA